MLRHPSICPQSPALLSAPSRCGGQKIYLCGPADELLRASICLCQRGPDKSRRALSTRLRSKSKISAVFTDGDYEPRVSEVRLCSESLGYKCLSTAHTPARLSALTWGRPAEGGGGRRCNRLLHRYAIGIRLQSGAIYPAVRRCNHDPGLFFFPSTCLSFSAAANWQQSAVAPAYSVNFPPWPWLTMFPASSPNKRLQLRRRLW